MSKYKDIYNKENDRKEDNIYLIKFYSMGDMWNAFEWSAFLSKKLQEGGENGLKPIKSTIGTEKEVFVKVGLPFKSFEKYFPNLYNDASKFTVDGGILTINVYDSLKDFNYTVSNYKGELSAWKDSIEFSENKKKVKGECEMYSINEDAFRKISKMITTYPMERTTPMQWGEFLSNLKQEIHKIL